MGEILTQSEIGLAEETSSAAGKLAGRKGRDEEPLIRPDTPNQGQVLISLGEDTPGWNRTKQNSS
jgi:hypothetical protein